MLALPVAAFPGGWANLQILQHDARQVRCMLLTLLSFEIRKYPLMVPPGQGRLELNAVGLCKVGCQVQLQHSTTTSTSHRQQQQVRLMQIGLPAVEDKSQRPWIVGH